VLKKRAQKTGRNISKNTTLVIPAVFYFTHKSFNNCEDVCFFHTGTVGNCGDFCWCVLQFGLSLRPLK